MSEISISPQRIPTYNMLAKPSYLVVLEGPPKKGNQYFITIEQPEFCEGMVHVKGLFADDSSEEEIAKNYVDMLTSASRELLCEVYLPLHRVIKVRNLVFRAK